MILREHTTVAAAIQALREAEDRLSTASVPPVGGAMAAGYVQAISDIEPRLGNAFDRTSILDGLHTRRYWYIAENSESRAPAVNWAVNREIETIQAFFARQKAELHELGAFLALDGMFVILDTNVLMHCVPIDQINWRDETKHLSPPQQPAPRLIAPLAVVRELDRKKFEGSDTNRKRAQKAIKSLHDLRQGCGPDQPAIVRAAGGSAATLEIPRDDVGRVPLVSTDDELIAFGRFIATAGNRTVAIATRDLNVQIKAARAGLHVIWLPDAYLKDRALLADDDKTAGPVT